MDLAYVINHIKQGQIAMATFGDERWYVTNLVGFIRYCDMNGDNIEEIVELTPSNILAHYTFIN